MSGVAAGERTGTVTLRLLPGGRRPESRGERPPAPAPVVPIDRRLRRARRIHPSAAEIWGSEDD